VEIRQVETSRCRGVTAPLSVGREERGNGIPFRKARTRAPWECNAGCEFGYSD